MERQAQFVRRAAEETSHVAVERAGAVYLLPTRQKAGVDRLLKPKWKEHRHLQRAVEALERLGVGVRETVFVDVGAHVGTTAIAAVIRFGFDSAVAFEPEVSNYRLLRANVAINDLDTKVVTFNVAISNRVGSAELKLRPEFGAKHRLVENIAPGATTVTVPLTTLDVLAQDGGLEPERAGLLWLDVERHELEALEGATMLLKRSVPVVIEFIPRVLRGEGKLDQLCALLARHYTHLVDLREKGGPEPVPLGDLPALAKRYGRGFTDLLVLRLPR
jgi:FkbM family methyltransferase